MERVRYAHPAKRAETGPENDKGSQNLSSGPCHHESQDACAGQHAVQGEKDTQHIACNLRVGKHFELARQAQGRDRHACDIEKRGDRINGDQLYMQRLQPE